MTTRVLLLKVREIYLFLLFFLLGPLAAGGYGQGLLEPLELSRKGAIALALQKNLDLRVQALSTRLAETSLERSRGIYDPLLTSSMDTGETSSPGQDFLTRSTLGSIRLSQYLPTGGNLSVSTQSGYTTAESDNSDISTSDWQSSAGLRLSQPLLKEFGREVTELNIILAANNVQDSLESFRFYTEDTVLVVINTYNRLFVLREILQSRRAAVESAQALLKRITSRRVPGAQQRIEVANAQYAISQRRRDLVDAERDVRDQEARLRYLIGMRLDRDIIPVDAPSREEPLETLQQAIDIALENRSDLEQLRISLENSRLQERVARHQLLPNLALDAGSGWSGIAGSVGDSYREVVKGDGFWWSAGLSFRLPLGNTVAESSYRQNRIRTEQIEKRLAAATWKVEDEIESDMRALISARLQMQVADQSLQAARERLERYRERQMEGGRAVQDMIDAEADWYNARNGQFRAQEYFAYSVKLLWRDMGVLLDRVNIEVDVSAPMELTSGEPPRELARFTPPLSFPEPPPELAAETTRQTGATLPIPVPPAAGEAGAPPADEAGSGTAPVGPATHGTVAAVPAAPGAAGPADGAAPTAHRYTLKVGEYVARQDLAEAREKLRDAGLEATVAPGPPRPTRMFRVAAATVPGLDRARAVRDRLKAARAEAFILPQGDGYRVYAGSFSSRERAGREQQRLAARDLETTIEPASVQVPTLVLTAGDFSSPEAALSAVKALEDRGLTPAVQQLEP